MSDNSRCLPCPLCLHAGVFDCVQSLRNRLIYVSTCNLVCPICQEEICGLDKLTIHLFTHVKVIPENKKRDDTKASELSEKDIPKTSNNTTIQHKKPRSSTSKNKSLSPNNSTQMKFVKIYPKLPVISVSSMPFLEFSPGTQSLSGKECVNNNNELSVPALKIEKITTQPNTTCNVCGIQFIDENILKMHKCLIHNIDDNKNHDFTRYHCHLCSKNFKMRGSLMVHLRVAHYGYNSSSNSLATPCQITEEKKQDALSENNKVVSERLDGKQWQCDVCRKCFTTKYFLKKHKRLHTGETPYSCAQCNKSFTFQQSYHKHLLYHNDEKPHICNFCGRAFKELSTLHNHQRIHTGEKPFSCETCGKCFRQRVSYLVHRRIHTGVMPYKCTACDKNFRYKVSQRTHRCQVQPPGTVVRQNGDLVEKLKKKNISKDSVQSDTEGKSQTQNYSLSYNNISEANAELVRAGAKLSLEDTETENYNIIAAAFSNNELNDNIFTENIVFENAESHINKKLFEINTNIENVNESINFAPIDEKVTLSPSEILKGLCLSQKEDKYYPCENHEQ